MRLFGTSGIRMKNLDPLIAYKVGFALSQSIEDVVVARDSRTTGDMIKSALISGLLRGGATVTDIGIAPTPTLGFSTRDHEVGVMITASHNPPEYNGIKLFKRDGTPYSPEEEREIEEIIFKDNFKKVDWRSVGEVLRDEKALRKYREHILKHLEINRRFNVVVDCANGASSVVSPYLFTDVGSHVLSLNAHIDGRFVGRMPEPNRENLQDTMKIVKGLNKGGGDYIGIAHDGDGDRMVAIDERGRIGDFDKLLAVFSRYIVEKTGSKVIITTVDASMALEEYLGDGVKVVRTKVGDVAVSQELSKYRALFGGEPSGTWIHGDVHLTPDGILSGLRILEMMEYFDEKLCNLLDDVPSYVNLREKISCEEDKKSPVIRYVIEHGEKIFQRTPETVDGARFNLEGGWVLIRPSGTEPCIRIRVEGKNSTIARDLLEKSVKLIKEALRSC
ncbi:MAG TPA: phosphoglucosamine mutase [Methanothermococcus okinawensis]|uniref:Phosphoglucosamine mutase n=1 Tax=Methanothermococcus okinawensis TaxID=155863 RepID=A0A832ZJ43_9EURY|nr:phosphoglucosamine mutase [Methanothermococcus okinawensis]HIP90798.1 phosphoglucosamine mutase [Methanothermococcus okinawensis]